MRPAQRVVTKFALNSEGAWTFARDELERFSERLERLHQVAANPQRNDAQEVLLQFTEQSLRLPTRRGAAFFEWLAFSCTKLERNRILALEPDQLKLSDLPRLGTLIKQWDAYAKAIQLLVQEIPPQTFRYRSWKITNPDNLSGGLVQAMLESVDFLHAVFARRGVEKFLHAGVQEIRLRQNDDEYLADFAGAYDPERRLIMLFPRILESGGRVLKSWVLETFLHEFGHFIHMSYITGEAKAAWDSGWKEIDDIAEPELATREQLKAINEAKARLQMVSPYAMKDKKEDFAETFVAFMAAPQRLSPIAKFRMQRALSLSGLYGKRVMRLGSRR